MLKDVLGGLLGKTSRRRSDGIVESLAKSAARAVSTQIGRQLIRGVLGSLIGRRREPASSHAAAMPCFL